MNYQTMILEDGSELNLVHFQYVIDGVWHIACTPGLTIMHAHERRGYPWIRSEDPRACNCPMCKATEQFKIASAQNPMLWRAA